MDTQIYYVHGINEQARMKIESNLERLNLESLCKMRKDIVGRHPLF